LRTGGFTGFGNFLQCFDCQFARVLFDFINPLVQMSRLAFVPFKGLVHSVVKSQGPFTGAGFLLAQFSAVFSTESEIEELTRVKQILAPFRILTRHSAPCLLLTKD